MKPGPPNFTARTGLLVLAAFIFCSFFLLCNYILLDQRIGAVEEKLESLQRSQRQNPNVSFDDQKGVKHLLHTREKRSASLPDLEKRLRFLEKRYFFFECSASDCIEIMPASHTSLNQFFSLCNEFHINIRQQVKRIETLGPCVLIYTISSL